MASDDITPKLKEAILNQFGESIANDPKLQKIIDKVAEGKATYDDAREYSKIIAGHASDALLNNLSSDVLPNGRLYYHIAKGTVEPTLTESYTNVCDVAQEVQQILNEASGISLNAIRAELDKDRINGFINRASDEIFFDDIKDWFFSRDNLATFTNSVVNDVIKANCGLQKDAGLHPKVERSGGYKCCEWCADKEGSFEYGSQPADFFRQHERCTCHISFSGKGIKYRVNGRWNKGSGNSQKGVGTDEVKTRIELEKRILSNIDNLKNIKEFIDNITDN